MPISPPSLDDSRLKANVDGSYIKTVLLFAESNNKIIISKKTINVLKNIITSITLETEFQAWWDAFEWNPKGEGYDPNASPKPTWEDLIYFAKDWIFEEGFEPYRNKPDAFGTDDFMSKTYNEILEYEKEIAGMPNNIKLEHPIDHPSALLYLIDPARARTGVKRKSTVIHKRYSDDVSIYLHTAKDIYESIGKLADIQDTIETSKALYREHLNELKQLSVGKSKQLDQYTNLKDKYKARATAFYEYQRLIQQYDFDYAKSVVLKMIDKVEDVLPTDPKIVNMIFKERLEAIASQRQREIQTIISEVATVLPPGCIEEANALQELATMRRQVAIRMNSKTHVSEMEQLLDDFERSVADIKVLNTPEWDWVSGGGFIQAPETNPVVIGWDATKFPMVMSTKSDTTYNDIAVDTTINNLPINSKSLFQIPLIPDANNHVELTENTGGNLAFGIYKLKVFATNECGPGRLDITIEHPEQKINDPVFSTAGIQDSTWNVVGGTIVPISKGIVLEALSGIKGVILSESIPLIDKARYDISLIAEKTLGNRLFAGCVQFEQRDGTPLTAYNFNSNPLEYPNGWIAVGDYFFWNSGITTKQIYTFSIGRGTDSVGRIPRGVKSMKVGIAILDGQSVDDFCKVTLESLTVDELVWYEQPIGI